MVVLPDSNFQNDHQKVVQDLVDSGLKTLNPKNLRKTSKDPICHENILGIDIKQIRDIDDQRRQNDNEAIQPTDGAKELKRDEEEPDSRMQQIIKKKDNGKNSYLVGKFWIFLGFYLNEYKCLANLPSSNVIEDEFRISINTTGQNHDFFNLSTPNLPGKFRTVHFQLHSKLKISYRFIENSDFSRGSISNVGSKSHIFLLDAIFEFWQNIWKRSQKSVVIIQLDPTDSNYFKEQELKNEMTLK